MAETPDRECRVLHLGTVALDAIDPDEDISQDPLFDTVGRVTPDGKVEKEGNVIGIFTEPDLDRARELRAGGVANALNALAELARQEREVQRNAVGPRIEGIRQQTRVGIMARIGKDPAGERYCKLLDPDIDRALLEVIEDGKTGLSYVRQHDGESGGRKGKVYAIQFRPGASGEWSPTTEEVQRIREWRPDCVNISYPGLFPYGMDKSDGKELSAFIRQLQEFCPMVGYDTHGPTKKEHVLPSLTHVDTFNANAMNAARIFLDLKSEDVEQIAIDDLLPRIEMAARGAMCFPTGRSRLFTISHSAGTQVIFQSWDGVVQSRHCHSPCARIKAAGGVVGAGDVQNGTTLLNLAREMGQEWRTGSITFDDVCRAATIGQISTTLHLQGNGRAAYQGVTMQKMERVAQSGRQFESIEELREALLSA